jgi:hypothetical protein
MQRLIIAAGVLLVLMLGAGAFALRVHRQNQSTQVWLPMPINPALTSERRDATVILLKQRLGEHALLARVSKDVGLTKKLRYATDDEAATDLGKRLFVELGQADTSKGKVPSINIGMKCKVKEFKTMGEVTNRLGKDIFTILGIPEPTQDSF